MKLTIILLATALAGCVAPTATVKTPFDEEVHKPYLATGDSTIVGQGFLRQQGGGVVTCAGSQVMLLPATDFFREFVSLYRSGYRPQYAGEQKPEYRSIVKLGQCDAQGDFEFSNLPAGAWLVATEVNWTVDYVSQGGGLLREVQLLPGSTLKVLLSDQDRVGGPLF